MVQPSRPHRLAEEEQPQQRAHRRRREQHRGVLLRVLLHGHRVAHRLLQQLLPALPPAAGPPAAASAAAAARVHAVRGGALSQRVRLGAQGGRQRADEVAVRLHEDLLAHGRHQRGHEARVVHVLRVRRVRRRLRRSRGLSVAAQHVRADLRRQRREHLGVYAGGDGRLLRRRGAALVGAGRRRGGCGLRVLRAVLIPDLLLHEVGQLREHLRVHARRRLRPGLGALAIALAIAIASCAFAIRGAVPCALLALAVALSPGLGLGLAPSLAVGLGVPIALGGAGLRCLRFCLRFCLCLCFRPRLRRLRLRRGRLLRVLVDVHALLREASALVRRGARRAGGGRHEDARARLEGARDGLHRRLGRCPAPSGSLRVLLLIVLRLGALRLLLLLLLPRGRLLLCRRLSRLRRRRLLHGLGERRDEPLEAASDAHLRVRDALPVVPPPRHGRVHHAAAGVAEALREAVGGALLASRRLCLRVARRRVHVLPEEAAVAHVPAPVAAAAARAGRPLGARAGRVLRGAHGRERHAQQRVRAEGRRRLVRERRGAAREHALRVRGRRVLLEHVRHAARQPPGKQRALRRRLEVQAPVRGGVEADARAVAGGARAAAGEAIERRAE